MSSFNSFNHELQLKNNESAIKNERIDLVAELKHFKFVTTLVSEFKRIESDNITKYTPFPRTQKQKQFLMKKILIIDNVQPLS